MFNIKKLVGVAALFALGSVAQAGVITLNPDLGPFWQPVGPSGTYIYANSFVADQSGNVSDLSSWLMGGSPNVVFEILSSIGGIASNGPSASSVLAKSAVITGQTFDTLTSVDGGAITNFTSLVAGSTYWFAIDARGMTGDGSYVVGGHTRTGGTDVGSFWYSNDSIGQYFDGQNLTPEMAFSVTIAKAEVPEPGSLALIGLGLAGLAASRRRKLV